MDEQNRPNLGQTHGALFERVRRRKEASEATITVEEILWHIRADRR